MVKLVGTNIICFNCRKVRRLGIAKALLVCGVQFVRQISGCGIIINMIVCIIIVVATFGIATLNSPSCDVEGNARETDHMQNISRTRSPCCDGGGSDTEFYRTR